MVSAMTGSERAPGPGVSQGARGEATREVLALRNLVAVYRHLSGLAVQDADLAAVAQLIAEQTGATVAIVSPTMDILTAAAPGETGDRAAESVRDLVVHPRLGEVLTAASRARRPLRLPGAQTSASVIVAPVLVGDDVPAHLLTLDTGEHLAEPRVDDQVAHGLGGPVAGFPGRRRGQDVHGRAHDRDRGAGLPGDQPGHRREVGALGREPGQMAVHRDEVAQRQHLTGGLRARDGRGTGARLPAAGRRFNHVARHCLVLEHKDMPRLA